MSDEAEHWDAIYGKKRPDELSWFQPHLERSFGFVEKCGLLPHSAIIDVGGGTSTFVDDLCARGYQNVTVLDISAAAIDAARQRLGPRGHGVRWRVDDITKVQLPAAAFEFWHDRAVFHFLREPEARRRYVAQVARAVRPGGHIVVAAFGPQGPERCSGLEVVRYSADGLHAEFGATFDKVESVIETHTTPWGTEQEFVYCYCRLG
jgi:SAM-dependent methyltransferase